MGSSANTEYCSFTKAVEHLGDRWSLLILRELAMFGPQGFNTLAAEVPGHISRSVLVDRLRSLADLGLVARGPESGADRGRYRLVGPGQELVPTLLSLRDWADSWLPQDPAMVERDPDIVLAWLAERIDRRHLPEQQAIVELVMRYRGTEHRSWIILEREVEPLGCLEDPELDESRYVYLEGGASTFISLSRGQQAWGDAIADGVVQVFGNPELVAQAAHWFLPAGEPGSSPSGREATAGLRKPAVVTAR